jgi:hypothetical protein
MKNVILIACGALGVCLVSAPAFAQIDLFVPEPLSLSLMAGGIAAIAVVKRFHRK